MRSRAHTQLYFHSKIFFLAMQFHHSWCFGGNALDCRGFHNRSQMMISWQRYIVSQEQPDTTAHKFMMVIFCLEMQYLSWWFLGNAILSRVSQEQPDTSAHKLSTPVPSQNNWSYMVSTVCPSAAGANAILCRLFTYHTWCLYHVEK